jgi:hypothetical protein
MSKFKGFTEAARLYAQNADVVELMWKSLTEGVNEFLDYVKEEVLSRIEPRDIYDKRDNEYRYWRITRKADLPGKNPYVYFLWTDHKVVAPGELYFWVGTSKPNLTDTIRERIYSLRDDADLKPYWRGRKKDSWHLLSGKIAYPEGDPVEIVAPVIAALLLKVAAASEG